VSSGFTKTEDWLTGVNSATAIAQSPDGRLLIAQQGGALRVVKNGVLLSAPFVQLGVDATDERGLIGVTLHPGFAINGYVYVHAFDDEHIIAGQGTIGLEIAAQTKALGVELDAVLACASGGGLVAGIALALERLNPSTAIHVCEPAGFDDHARSLSGGVRVSNTAGASSICDALLASTPGDITFPIVQRLLHSGLVVCDDDVLRAMAIAFRDLKLVVEPGGAVALACVLTGKLPLHGRTIAVVCSGGNVDPVTYARALATL